MNVHTILAIIVAVHIGLLVLIVFQLIHQYVCHIVKAIAIHATITSPVSKTTHFNLTGTIAYRNIYWIAYCCVYLSIYFLVWR